jgi:hypothetical protein
MTTEEPKQLTFDTLVSLSKRRGFVFPSSEVYGGIGGFWDYGPLGVERCRWPAGGTGAAPVLALLPFSVEAAR